MNNRIENQQITETVTVHNLLSDAKIGTWQADYPLTAVDFEHIKNGKPLSLYWAHGILLTSLGYGLSLAAKFASKLFNIELQIYAWEWIAIVMGFILAIILYLAGLCLPNDRKKVMKKIDSHFKNSPKHRQVLKGDKS